MEKSFLPLVSFLVVIGLVNFAALWFIHARLMLRMDELENLINELGSMVGEWIDGQSKE